MHPNVKAIIDFANSPLKRPEIPQCLKDFAAGVFGEKINWAVDTIYASEGRKNFDIVLNTNRYDAGDFDEVVPVSVFETDNVVKSAKLWYLRHQMNETIVNLTHLQELVTAQSAEVSSLHYQIEQLEKAE